MIYVLFWWLIIEILGWAALPIAMRIFRWLPDRGYTLSKALGLLLASYILWLGASTGLLRNDLGGILFSVLLVAGLSAWFYFRRPRPTPDDSHPDQEADPANPLTFLRQNPKLLLTVEILFFVAFAAWAVLRAYASFKIEPAGGEKFMEIAFLNAVLRSPQFPPLDPWLSGFAISYYYFGYVMMALMTRLSGAPAGIGFDLYDALLFALTVLGAFGIAYNLVAVGVRRRLAQSPRLDAKPSNQPLWAGLLGSLLVPVMGNLEGVWESLYSRGLLPASFWQWLNLPKLAIDAQSCGSWYPGACTGGWMWWWRASRVIHDTNFFGQSIEIIDEFPFFSFMLGDNHPHVLALPFVLLAVALAFNLLLSRGKVLPRPTVDDLELEPPTPSDLKSKIRNLSTFIYPILSFEGDWVLFIFSALIIGALGFLNTWDLPIYLGLAVLAYGLGEIFAHRPAQSGIASVLTRLVVLGLGLGIASVLLYIFFYISFSSQAAGILPYIFSPTRLPQYLTMFGTLIFLAACFLGVSLHHQARQAEGNDQPGSRSLWRTALVWWVRILLICAGLFLLILLLVTIVAALSLSSGQASPDASAITSLLGNMTIGETLGMVIGSRLSNPWLLLLASGLLALAIANVEGLLKRKDHLQEDEEKPAIHSDLFAFLLIFIALALSLSVDFVYLRDSFGTRMNTVFKFYYQAWVMLGLAGAYAIWWLWSQVKNKVGRSLFLVGAVLLISGGLVYTLMAGFSRADGFSSQPNLDGTSSLANANPDDWAAIQWLNANVQGTPVILEAPSGALTGGGSYRYEGRISAFTGLPTVLGWAIHESQWRGTYDEQGKREPDIATIYTTKDGQVALDLLHKWNVKYIILGNPERSYIEQLCTTVTRNCNTMTALRKFDSLFTPVFSQGTVTIYAVP
jgi:YYY domain-containing protein